MTEAEWDACADPTPMLEFLRGKASDRKLRLFIADGARKLGAVFGREQEAVGEMHERVAEGLATEEDLERFLLRNMPDLWEHRAPGGNLPSVWDSSRMLVRDRFKLAPLTDGKEVWPESAAIEYADMCNLLREVFGNPFRPAVLDPSWLTWHEGAVRKMAQAIYEERRFADLPILADALEDAGCADDAILPHCRGPGEHVRGCWVVDLLTGRK